MASVNGCQVFPGESQWEQSISALGTDSSLHGFEKTSVPRGEKASITNLKIMPLTNTTWPESPAPKAVKEWLETLFTLLDSKDTSAPESAAALYTEDAVVYGMAGKAVGTEAIIKARENSWAHMDSRKHEVLRVYSSKNDFSDLLLIGKLSAKFKNGKECTDEFIVRLVLQGNTTINPKGSLYQIWADSAPWLKAIHGN